MKIEKEGYIIIRNTTLGALLLTVGLFYFVETPFAIALSILLLLFVLFVVCFFRLPYRDHKSEKDSVYSPADGTVVVCERVYEGEYLKRDCLQISVFMSVTNVHANWYPMDGEIEYFRHHHGDFMVAWHPKSSTENERTTIVIKNNKRQLLFRQIAGLVARRIVCNAVENTTIKQNERMGFIKFGSRLDLFLPLDVKVNVKLNDKVVGSQTILAEFADKNN